LTTPGLNLDGIVRMALDLVTNMKISDSFLQRPPKYGVRLCSDTPISLMRGGVLPKMIAGSLGHPDTQSRNGARTEQTCSGGRFGKRSRKP
jgi:hypothetical protein